MEVEEVPDVIASLSISIYVTCPNEECESFIDLLDEKDVDGVALDDDSELMRQVWSTQGIANEEFLVDEVTCTQCKTKFSVTELEW